ncbi:MAG: hypothetical protein H7X70_02465, partial [Candidatus Kapabacteria bacterium]|nr:hypothetical protein [Candidatus Kapabacteria bacterium]
MEEQLKKQLWLIFVGLFIGLVALQAQTAPLINVKSAAAEFISSNDVPEFVIRKIFVTGHIDTMKAVIKTSTVRALGGEYARYKPVLDSIRWRSLDSLSSEVFVWMHLEGKIVPLPTDSVRGAVRLTVSAAVWSGSDWLGTTSEAFTVPVANVDIPKPQIVTSNVKTIRTGLLNGIQFDVTGIRLSIPSVDSIDHMPDIRTFEFDDVVATYDKKSIRTLDRESDDKRSIALTAIRNGDGTIAIKATLEGKPLPQSQSSEPFTFSCTV